VFLEIGYDQGEAAMQLAGAAPELAEPKILRDLAGRDRVLMLRRS
jgi:methylase of polypeptide subunit release factors